MTHEQFMRLFLEAERELLRYVMVVVPNAADARDVVQETAAALWRSVDRYDPTRPFIPWACRFALNEARRFVRDESRRRRFLESDVVEVLAEDRISYSAQLDARRAHLAECLSKLPEPQRELVRGYYLDEVRLEQLAQRLALTVDAAYKQLQRVRLALHECIQRKSKAEFSP